MKLDISWRSIWRVFASLALLWFLFQVQDILVILFLVFIFVAALNPVVTRWQKKMPRILAVTLIYLIFFLAVTIFATIFFAPLIEQVNVLSRLVPEKINTIIPFFKQLTDGQEIVSQLSSGLQQFSGTLSSFSGNLVSTTLGVFGGLFTAFTILVLTFYLLLEEDAAKHFLGNLLPPKTKESVFYLLNKISNKMGAWVRGQLILMLIIGVLDYIILLIMGVPAPLALAMWGGLMEVVPFLGPVLGAVPAIVVALVATSPLNALIVGLLMIVLIQQLEGHFIVPKVMEKAVGISPVNVILALLIGGKLYGIVGALLAVPIAAIIAVLVQNWTTVDKVFRGKGE
jgi:predicted PurR-regulated permease PerM